MNDKQQLTVISPAPVVDQPMALSTRDPESILRFALEKGATVDVIERLMLVRDKLNAEQSKAAFDMAMKAFQDECPVIYKGKPVLDENKHKLFDYAPLEDVISVARPFLSKQGFSWQFGEEDSKDGTFRAVCIAKHIGGHQEKATATLGKVKGNRITDAAKVDAATMTMAQRRAFCAVFGIVVAGQDMDSRLPEKKRDLGPSKIGNMRTLRKELWDALIDIRGQDNSTKAATTWLKHVGIMLPDEKWDELDPARLIEVIEAAKAQLQKESE